MKLLLLFLMKAKHICIVMKAARQSLDFSLNSDRLLLISNNIIKCNIIMEEAKNQFCLLLQSFVDNFCIVFFSIAECLQTLKPIALGIGY